MSAADPTRGKSGTRGNRFGSYIPKEYRQLEHVTFSESNHRKTFPYLLRPH